jgi:hypothetical protein
MSDKECHFLRVVTGKKIKKNQGEGVKRINPEKPPDCEGGNGYVFIKYGLCKNKPANDEKQIDAGPHEIQE